MNNKKNKHIYNKPLFTYGDLVVKRDSGTKPFVIEKIEGAWNKYIKKVVYNYYSNDGDYLQSGNDDDLILIKRENCDKDEIKTDYDPFKRIAFKCLQEETDKEMLSFLDKSCSDVTDTQLFNLLCYKSNVNVYGLTDNKRGWMELVFGEVKNHLNKKLEKLLDLDDDQIDSLGRKILYVLINNIS